MLRSHGGEPLRTAGPAVRWTVEQVLALAPDDASRKAGSKLGSARPWSDAGFGGAGFGDGQGYGEDRAHVQGGAAEERHAEDGQHAEVG